MIKSPEFPRASIKDVSQPGWGGGGGRKYENCGYPLGRQTVFIHFCYFELVQTGPKYGIQSDDGIGIWYQYQTKTFAFQKIWIPTRKFGINTNLKIETYIQKNGDHHRPRARY